MTQISILGCGWLGLPLGEKFVQNGYVVKGTTTSESKILVLKNAGIQPYVITIASNAISGEVSSFLENSEILIINIPPKLKGMEKDNFVEKIKILLPFIESSSVKKVLFVSSTSVYSDNNQIVTEATPPQPDSESGKQLLQAENLLINYNSIQTTVIRFGGLIGKERHPIRFLAGRKNIENPDAPINLIHLDDCIGIIDTIIVKNIWGETLNAVTPFHPTREKYYAQKAFALNLDLPEFNSNSSVGKTILSDKLISLLEYTFIQNPL